MNRPAPRTASASKLAVQTNRVPITPSQHSRDGFRSALGRLGGGAKVCRPTGVRFSECAGYVKGPNRLRRFHLGRFRLLSDGRTPAATAPVIAGSLGARTGDHAPSLCAVGTVWPRDCHAVHGLPAPAGSRKTATGDKFAAVPRRFSRQSSADKSGVEPGSGVGLV